MQEIAYAVKAIVDSQMSMELEEMERLMAKGPLIGGLKGAEPNWQISMDALSLTSRAREET